VFLSFYGWFRGRGTALGGIWKTFEGCRGCNEGQRATFRWGDGYDVASKWNFCRADANRFCVSGNQGWHHKVRMIRVDHAAQARPAHSARMRWLSWSMARRWARHLCRYVEIPVFLLLLKYISLNPLYQAGAWTISPKTWYQGYEHWRRRKMGGFEATTKSRCEEQHGNMNPSIEHFRIKPTPPFFLRKMGWINTQSTSSCEVKMNQFS
jgi:hypothetical protein